MKKNKMWLEKRGQGEIGQDWKNILVVVAAAKHKHRNEWQEVGMDYRMGLRPSKTSKYLRPISRKI